MKKKVVLLVLIAGLCFQTNGQILKKLGDKIKTKTEKKIDQKIDDKLNKTTKEVTKSEEKSNDSISSSESDKEVSNPKTNYKSKFDFVPGEKIILFEDFNEDAIGDFPANWMTNGSGEVVTVEGYEAKWLMTKPSSLYTYMGALPLPDNFTIQYDLMCTVPFSWSSGYIQTILSDYKDPDMYRRGQGGDTTQDNFVSNFNFNFNFDMHPGLKDGQTKAYGHYSAQTKSGRIELYDYFIPDSKRNVVKIAIWRQKQRVRLYVNEHKVLDLPQILPSQMKPNVFEFKTGSFEPDDAYFINNIRIAIGNPDTRNKLLTEGKLVTHGILFAVNSAEIKPESFGVLKEIASILKENSTLQIKIIGHTDSDGDAKKNQELSLKRAESVKNSLASDFEIDIFRMEVEGKGASEPIFPNSNALNKANNRRVEFLKIQ